MRERDGSEIIRVEPPPQQKKMRGRAPAASIIASSTLSPGC
jgi:hypothetical protein